MSKILLLSLITTFNLEQQPDLSGHVVLKKQQNMSTFVL